MHWGSRGRKGFHTPRLAVSWGCADDAYEPPYFSRKHLPYPPMALRGALACGQMLVYHERFPMTLRQLSLYYRVFKSQASEFHESYKAKVAAEYVAATKELMEVAGTLPAAPGELRLARVLKGKKAGKEAVLLKNTNKAEAAMEEGVTKGKKVRRQRINGVDAASPETQHPAVVVEAEEEAEEEDKKQPEVEDASKGGNDSTANAAASSSGTSKRSKRRSIKKAAKKAKVGSHELEMPALTPATMQEAAGAGVARVADTGARANEAVATAGEDEEREEGPGWEGLLGSAGDSENEAMEDALDAMLDADLAGRIEALHDDFDELEKAG